MTPILTPKEMAAVDAAASEPVDVPVARAGSAVARAARSMMGGTYGRVVNVIAGKGNNGADGHVAGTVLADDGVLVRFFDAADCPAVLPSSDLVIDAAYGTGFRGTWAPPNVGGARVLAGDIPSGVDGLTGVAASGALAAERTVTFAALKPGLLFGDGPRLAGRVDVVDIGLDVVTAAAHRVQRSDVVGWWRPRSAEAHKWTRSVRVVAGSSGMTGAAGLSAGAAMRASAGIVWLSSPGVDPSPPVEVVGRALPASGWADTVLAELDRFGALVVGPGLGRADTMPLDVATVGTGSPVPVLIDGDGLFAVAHGPNVRDAISRRTASTVLTPHDGEYHTLMGDAPGPDRIDACRRLAAEWSVVALLKGPSTVIAEPGGRVLVVDEGDERLATAGSGDVLSGVVGALIASGLDAFEAAAAAAWIHAAAANALPGDGLVASDLLTSLPGLMESLR
ncbi:MAG: NAD(P)H-hydrate dehydratase [Acidimicrobiia bacterium]|nr:NAD(P)H-hydrate dehydratase [Acidimicrobiia bacterium]